MNEFFEKEHIPMDVDKFATSDPVLTNIDQGLNNKNMHFLYDLERFVDLIYKHTSLVHPVVQHFLILNINRVVHKLIRW
jgi:hypothetical protein